MIKPLSEFQKDEDARLESISDPVLELKLMEYGFVEGATIRMGERAPGGDPILLESAQTKLMLRRKEAEAILCSNL
jgi:ferrous iron transport protein A